jgi:hypothetical protein
MKLQYLLVSAFICAAAATPLPDNRGLSLRSITELNTRQTVTDEEDELENLPCRNVTFIFARGSTEPGNMVSDCKVLFIGCFEVELNRAQLLDPKSVRISRQPLVKTQLLARVLDRHTMQLWKTTIYHKTQVPQTLEQQRPCLNWPIQSVQTPKSSPVATGEYFEVWPSEQCDAKSCDLPVKGQLSWTARFKLSPPIFNPR